MNSHELSFVFARFTSFPTGQWPFTSGLFSLLRPFLLRPALARVVLLNPQRFPFSLGLPFTCTHEESQLFTAQSAPFHGFQSPVPPLSTLAVQVWHAVKLAIGVARPGPTSLIPKGHLTRGRWIPTPAVDAIEHHHHPHRHEQWKEADQALREASGY